MEISMNKFKAQYIVSNGKADWDQPQFTSIRENYIHDDMDEQDLRDVYVYAIKEAFNARLCAIGENEDEFLEWAKGIIEARSN